ncbi:amino acid permease [Cytobacillus sp. Hz8]|uniref:amino acid permease n=1 Tax=Cytobacillus sp. Hz8 TaxID=3347168 RepID=UPI0035E1EBD3
MLTRKTIYHIQNTTPVRPCTVFSLVGLYILYAAALLPLIPTAILNENVSPMVASLYRWGIDWAGTVMNIILISAIFSAILSSIFGLGRMIRSLTDKGHAPLFLKDHSKVPYRGIIFSEFAMLLGLGFGLLFPRVYLVLITTGGFALLFTYAVIMASHIRFRNRDGCPPDGICQMPGFPYTSWAALISLILILLSMPLISGQGTGLIAGMVMVAGYALIYLAVRSRIKTKAVSHESKHIKLEIFQPKLLTEYSQELRVKENKKTTKSNETD